MHYYHRSSSTSRRGRAEQALVATEPPFVAVRMTYEVCATVAALLSRWFFLATHCMYTTVLSRIEPMLACHVIVVAEQTAYQ